MDKALLWTDARYHIQAEAQLDHEYWTLMKTGLFDDNFFIKEICNFLILKRRSWCAVISRMAN